MDATADGSYKTATRTEYLNDAANPTGYSQVVRETTTDPATGQIQKTIVYTLGHDQISQTTTPYTGGLAGTATTLVFGYDGHGSTRVLTDLAGAIATVAGVRQVLDYDAYGNLLGLTVSQAATSLLYSGEMFDAHIGQQYLRARWYDPATGRFNQLDPFFGNLQDPSSLHRYLYVSGDPVNGLDPTGQFTLGGLALNIGIGAVLGGLVSGGITAITTGGRGDFRGAALRGAMSGAVGGALGYSVGSLIGFAASNLGAGILLTGILETLGGSVFAGAAVGMLDAYMDNRDITEGAVEGAIFGLIMTPIYGIVAGGTFRIAGQSGRGFETGVGRKLLRTIWEDRGTFRQSQEFFRRWRVVFGNNHTWIMEHMIIKQRFYRGQSPWSPPGNRINKILQGLGDSGLNILPVPRGFNTWLFNHPAVSALFNGGFYATAFAGEYLIYQMATKLGETIANTILGDDNPSM